MSDPHPNKTLLAALDKAILAEVEGQHFYLMAASSTTDAKGKEVFGHFADEERRHAEFLGQQYQAILTTGKTDAAAALGGRYIPADIEGSPIFSVSLRQRIKGAHFEMTALSIGVQLELNAVQFYNAQAAAASAPDTGDPEVARFFRELSEWESGHYHYLLSQQETLQDDYWTEGGFSPF
jgi:rubrerythrin